MPKRPTICGPRYCGPLASEPRRKPHKKGPTPEGGAVHFTEPKSLPAFAPFRRCRGRRWRRRWRLLDHRRRRRCGRRHVNRRRGPAEAELATQRHAVRPGLAEVGVEEPGGHRVKARFDTALGTAALQRRVEGNLLVLGVE